MVVDTGLRQGTRPPKVPLRCTSQLCVFFSTEASRKTNLIMISWLRAHHLTRSRVKEDMPSLQVSPRVDILLDLLLRFSKQHVQKTQLKGPRDAYCALIRAYVPDAHAGANHRPSPSSLGSYQRRKTSRPYYVTSPSEALHASVGSGKERARHDHAQAIGRENSTT